MNTSGRPWYRRKGGLAAIGVLTLVLLVVGIAWAVLSGQIDGSAGGAAVTVDVPAGEGVSALAPTLAKDGVISSTFVFRAYLHSKSGVSVEAGTYVLHRHEAYSDILVTLRKGPQLVKLVIPEGFSLAQIASAVGKVPGHSASAFLAEARSGQVTSPYEPAGTDNLEGLLFPATYKFSPGTSDEGILEMMVDAFDQRAASVGLTQAASKLGITPYQAITVASLVIKEAKSSTDMGKVSRVIYNRLSDGMPLQIDYTVIYAAGGNPDVLDGKSPADVDPDSAYNTYTHSGLPPAPIASPGLVALDAALNPTAGNWLYYVVVSKNGSEAFCATYACQEANVAKAQSLGLLN